MDTRSAIRCCAWWPRKLARVSGGGRAFRVGGEEFSILFPGKSAQGSRSDLELLRAVIEGSAPSTCALPKNAAVYPGALTAGPPRLRRANDLNAAKAGVTEIFVTVSIWRGRSKDRKAGCETQF